jgi:uncharacterized protein
VTTYLLDVNVLLALCDPRHVHHEAAHRWFRSAGQHAWATCPLTENAFIRIASQPRYPNSPGGPGAVGAILGKFCASPAHVFWPDGVSLLDSQLIDWGRLLSSAHITDIYLLALAVHHKGKLATLDTAIPATAVAGGAEALERVEG